jgi:hypothetical protein
MHPIEAIKNHKLLFGGVVGLALLYFVFVRGAGGSSQAVADPNALDASAVAAGTQLQQAALQGQTAIAGLNIQAQSKATDDATALAIASLQAGVATNNNNLTATTQQLGITTSADVQKTVSSLQEALGIAQVNAGIRSQEINTSALTQSALIASQLRQTEQNHELQMAQTNGSILQNALSISKTGSAL